MRLELSRVALIGLAALACGSGAASQGEPEAEARALIDRGLAAFTGDLGELRRQGFVRVLTVYDRTTFFVADGRELGFEVELLRGWAKELNAGIGKEELETKLVFVPVAFDQLLPALLAGHGDVVAAGVTVTPERARQVAFTAPYLTGIEEVVVTSVGAAPLARVEDLAGRQVHVTAGSSFATSLRALSSRLVKEGAAAIEVVEVDPRLESEDLLELVNAGVVELTVCDEHVAQLWSHLFPNIQVRADLAVAPERTIAWAARPSNPELLASLSSFAHANQKGSQLGNVLFKRYYESSKWIRSPLQPEVRARFDALVSLFQEQTAGSGFDWLQIAAQAFQESGLDPAAGSSAGAVGLMQLTSATAKEMGCLDRTDPAQNVAAGVKYMVWLRDRFFAKDELEPGPMFDLCLAAYNAGPGRVKQWRTQAAERGLDPNRWFGNVEHVALEAIGRETVRYVGNVNKYYFAYRMSMNLVSARNAAFDRLRDGEGR